MQYKIKMFDGEYWWGGSAHDGTQMPYTQSTTLHRDFRWEAINQTMPMYISSMGRCIWSEEPFSCKIENGDFILDGDDIILESYGSTLKDAYLGAMNAHFKPIGETLETEFFRVPQYNTWMQLTYDQTQEGVLKYAHDIIDNGFTPGIIIIDEGWQQDYGNWSFDKLKFPDPKSMMDELHKLGFTVMLWVVPYVSPNGLFFVKHFFPWFCEENYFLRTENGNVAIIPWWDGFSAILDFTKECDRKFMDDQLHKLMDDYGVDGFKFDGGPIGDYVHCKPINGKANGDFTAAERNAAWIDFGMRYRFHEYKDTFKGGGKKSIQRLCDKNHAWTGDGLDSLIPNSIAQGLLGHPFICPDLIAGGQWLVRALNIPVDQELFVRMAQCSALTPMMQFSWAPWEAVDDEHLACIKAAQDLHVKYSDTMLTFVADADKTGEPILRSLEYNYPHKGYAKITDQFMLGEKILVAPIVTQGQTEREVVLPEGIWLGYNGQTYNGNCTLKLTVSLADIPYFEKIG